jgi:hypothetical protein
MGKKVIKLTDDLRIFGDLQAIKNTLLKDLSENETLIVAKDEESELDVAFIQLMLSLKSKAQKEGKNIKTEINLSSYSKKLLNLSGLNYVFSN